jgi:hypothetical protein
MRVYAIVGGTEYPFNDDADLAVFWGEDGLGSAPLHRLNERGPLQHGETDRGFRLDPRQVTYIFHIKGTDPADLWSKRRQMTQIFGPANLITMRHELPDGSVRCLDGYYVGGLSMSANDRLYRYQRVAVTLRAPDPSLYDPETLAETFQLGGGSDALVIPMTIPMVVGASEIDATQEFNYSGTWLSYPMIRITGPITDCVITNESTGEKLDFTGVTIAAGHYYDIDLRYGHKTVLLDGVTNKLADLSTDSDLATFHLAPHPEALGGVNSIRVVGSNVTETSKVEIVVFKRYIGL